MSEDGSDDDKQYEPSQTKLDDARKKGEFARSADINTAAAYAGFLIAGVAVGAGSLTSVGAHLAGIIGHSDKISEDVFSRNGSAFAGGLIRDLSIGLAPWFLVPALLVIVTIIAQRGFVFAPSKLEPKTSKISPIEQAKNKFGRNGLFEFAKSFFKLILYSVVLFFFLIAKLPEIIGAMSLSAGQMTAELLRLCTSLLWIVLIIASALGIVDYTWQKAEHLRKNRMSRKELTDEQKNSEGDPALKQQRRQKGISIAMNQMLADVPDADVIVVNPTHFAVALKWNRMSGGAPECVAKGVDLVAARIREVAQEHAVPVHSDPPTARALYATVEIGDEIPSDHFRAVAAAIRFADRIRKAARK